MDVREILFLNQQILCWIFNFVFFYPENTKNKKSKGIYF